MLGYIAAVVIVCSMVAVSCGGYATLLFVGDNAGATSRAPSMTCHAMYQALGVSGLVYVLIALGVCSAPSR